MRIFYLFWMVLGSLLVGASAARAQDSTVVAGPAALIVAATPPDTAAALHRLFTLQRDRGHTALKVGGAVLVVSSVLVVSTVHGSGYQELGLYLSGVLGMAGSVPILATGVIRTVTYSKKREQRAVQSWQQHQLTRHLKRALEDDSLLTAQARLAQGAVLAAAGPAIATPAALDTAAALHRLFATRRRIVRVLLPLTIAAGAGFVSVGSPLLGAATLVPIAAELATLPKYTKKREALALRALKEHRLPATQLQELKANYLRPAKAAR